MAVTLDEQKLYPDIGPALRKLDDLPALLRRLDVIDVSSREDRQPLNLTANWTDAKGDHHLQMPHHLTI